MIGHPYQRAKGVGLDVKKRLCHAEKLETISFVYNM